MGRMADRITAVLAAEVGSRTEWDESPGLYFLYLQGGVPRLRHAGIPDEIWAVDRPPVVLAKLSRALGGFADLLQATAPEGLHGIAFYCEVWTVAEAKAGTAEASELAADSMAHRLHLRPDRVEARSMWAVDRAGITYSATQRRDIDEQPVTLAHYPKPGRADLSGVVPESLDRIVTALLGVAMPARGRR